MGSRRRLVALALAAGASLLPAAAARADFSVGPALRDMRIAPGQAAAGSFDVRLDAERRNFVVEIEDVVQLPDGGYAYRPPSAARHSAASWLTVAPRSFAGRPSRIQPVDFQVRVPRTAEPGDHLASITVKQADRGRAAGALPVQAISFRLNVHVPGSVRESVVIGPLTAPSLAGRGPVEAGVVVRNTGNVRLDFDRANRGFLEIGEGPRLRFRGQLHPGRSRAFRVTWEDPPTLAHVTTRATVRVGGSRVERARSFWIVPWRQAGALGLVALAAAFVHFGGRRRADRYAQVR